MDCTIIEGLTDFQSHHPYKGNLDIAKLESVLNEKKGKVPMILVTITSSGGQPVSMQNLEQVYQTGTSLLYWVLPVLSSTYFE